MGLSKRAKIFASYFLKKDLLTGLNMKKRADLVRLGSGATWIVPKYILKRSSICYLVGAGENITFDLDIARLFSDHVYTIDPTPRAKEHYMSLCAKQGLEEARCAEAREDFIRKIKYVDRGLWHSSQEVKFFAPSNPGHISHSVVNLQQTKDFFVAKVVRLSELMKELGHAKLDLLKIDIEGAEYEVIRSILEDKLDIKILCVEFDEVYHPIDSEYEKRITDSARSLIEYGFDMVAISSWGNYTFVKRELF